MSVLRERVQNAFEILMKGDFDGFVRKLADTADVRWQNHRDIVNNEIEKQLAVNKQIIGSLFLNAYESRLDKKTRDAVEKVIQIAKFEEEL
jgi:hypothetical protein